MLSVGRIHNRDYLVNLAKDDYYQAGGEPPARWWGKGSESLGLRHQVTSQHLHRLMDGYHPFNPGKKLVQNAGKVQREIGWDFTFSVPKSVSIIWSQAQPDMRKAIEVIQESAVRKTLDFLEERATTRRGKGGKNLEPVTLISALFEHGTSRALDPNLHTHSALINVGCREDDTTGSVQLNRLLDCKMLAGALYRAELSQQLSEKLGFEIGPHLGGKPGLWDIKGISPELFSLLSKRRKQIKESLQAKGLTSAIAASVAALDTRVEKTDINRQELFSMWQEIGRSFEYRPPAPKFVQRDKESAKRKVGAETLDRLLERGSSFTEDELMRFIAERAPECGLGIDDIVSATRETLVRDDLVHLGDLGDGSRYALRASHERAKAVIKAMELETIEKRHRPASQQAEEQQLRLNLS